MSTDAAASAPNPGPLAGPFTYRERPCARCPWRTDVDIDDFTDDDIDKLRATNGGPGAEAAIGTPMMACHLDQPGTAHPLRVCAGWLAVVGRDHLPVRMAALSGLVPLDALAPREGWPQLWPSLRAILARRTRIDREG